MQFRPDPKPTRETDEDYLRYIRHQRCLVTQKRGVDPHHLDTRGSGGSDYTAVPLTREKHTEIGNMGLEEFEEKYNVNLWRQAHRLLRHYFSDHDTPMR